MNPKPTVPEEVTEWEALVHSLNEAETLLRQLSDQSESGSFKSEIAFLEEQIKSIKAEMQEKEAAVLSIIEKLSSDNLAYIAARLHYISGYKWSAVRDLVGKKQSVDGVKTYVYRAFKRYCT